MAGTKEGEPNIELLYYQKARKSMSEQERIQFVLKENGNCEGFLELKLETIYKKYFFILDLTERTVCYYGNNPKKLNSSTTKHSTVSISDITKVCETPKIKGKNQRDFAFEVCTTSEKLFLVAKDERDMRIWMQALKKAATSPFHVKDRKADKRETISSSLENLNIVNEAHTTSIIGGCVVKTPVSMIDKRRNNSNTVTRSALKILREGYCWKQGALMKNWKRRYFRLNAINLSYYENQKEISPIRSISTNDIRKVRILERFSNRSNVVEVDTPSRKFYMDPENIEDVQSWRKALEEIAMNNVAYLPRTKSV